MSLNDILTSLIYWAINNCASTVGVEEVQDAYLHCGSDGRQQHSDEERPDDIPLSPALRCWGWGGWNGEEQTHFLHTRADTGDHHSNTFVHLIQAWQRHLCLHLRKNPGDGAAIENPQGDAPYQERAWERGIDAPADPDKTQNSLLLWKRRTYLAL